MTVKNFKLDEDTVVLPKGTRVLLRVDISGEDGHLHKEASLAVVRDLRHHTYVLETPSGRRLTAQRDQITMQRADLLADLGRRHWDFRKLKDEVIYSAVVGSQAWGLANADSDEDVRGCFVAPFDESSGLWDMPYTLQDPTGESSYWEVAKLVEQGLRGDANTLETLWSPLYKEVRPLGERLLSMRRMFVSMNILGSFGRYAQSQFKKMARSLERDEAVRTLIQKMGKGDVGDAVQAAAFLKGAGLGMSAGTAKKEVHALCRSLFDRGLLPGTSFTDFRSTVVNGGGVRLEPSSYRPKNAYNLLRLLHSCVCWLRTGEPLIQVQGALRVRLLEIKEQKIPMEEVVAEAKAIADTLDDEAATSRLPERPDYRAADEFLKLCRREQARRVFALPSGLDEGQREKVEVLGDDWTPELVPEALPPDIDASALKSFLRRYIEPTSERHVQALWVALTGAHAYGFPSPDSDVDLKGCFVTPADSLLGIKAPKLSIDFLGDWEGRETDLTLNELGKCASLLLSGNGNMVERFLGPFQVLTTPLGHRLAALARGSLSQRVARHYHGFFRGMCRESGVEAKAGGRTAKRMLYAYRVSLTGIHLLRTGEVVTNVRPLAEQHGFSRVVDLINIKEQAEKQTVSESDAMQCLADYERLEVLLHEALEKSVLPEEPPNADEMNAFVVGQRLRLMNQRR